MKRTSKAQPRPTRRYRLNWQRDLPDQRDYLYSLRAPEKKAKRLPKSVDLRPLCSPVFDQGQIGSCTGNALAGALEYLELRQLQDEIDDLGQAEVFEKSIFAKVSRLFIYYNERSIENRVNEDSGATLRDGIKSLVEWGACRESLWPYANPNVFKKPVARAYDEARAHRISSYFRLEDLASMKQCLAAGYPFVFGFAVYSSFETKTVARTGKMPMPKLTERMLGGHAVLAVGYDDVSRHLIVRNSWGESWGKGGYFFMPYSYAENAMLSQDFWTIRR